jgi:hypothetical protein
VVRKRKTAMDFDAVADSNVINIVREDTVDTEDNADTDVVDEIDIADDTVVNTEIVIKDEINVDTTPVINIDNNVNHNNAIDHILNNERVKSTRVQRGLYLDRDIDAVLSRLLKKGGKGAKSDIINDLLRAAFVDRGLLK